MVKWEQDLEEMKLDLENNKKSLENEKGFTRIVELNDYFLGDIKKYKKSFEVMEEFDE